MENLKRKADDDRNNTDKRMRTKKQWQVPRKGDRSAYTSRTINPGDSGIWATCNKGREGKCVNELRELFAEYAAHLYGDHLVTGEPVDGDGEAGEEEEERESADIESSIQAEVAGIRKPTSVQLCTPVRIDVQCVVFFRTVSPIEPVSFVKKICEDAIEKNALRRARIVKRLSPMTLLGRATTEGLEKVAIDVLAPHFHQIPFQSKKFAIRPTLRNHNVLSRDSIIKQVASIVGQGHQVDLKNYELLIIVEVYQNICGVSVVDNSFERLKRFNLAEIFDPTPNEADKDVKDISDKPTNSEAPANEPQQETQQSEQVVAVQDTPVPASMDLT
ncbi:hypothetical protein LTR62_008116 [Meristemomyces frigidus]|uniref:THUMP domain-containing protein n=1 Tax=Meristemomyces frigidus TaxID=1508187 RepID=A0AAN7T9W1_9PEZI|nr:hypothetical protein LTR62_008116 [Meristemomyces frigidus]